LIELIGQGAMGQVWKAKDLLGEEARERNPFIAIKVLNSDFEAHPEAFVAMHREASRAQKLAHPNVVTVYTFDRDDMSGRAFIAMELLDGEPLDKLIRRQTGGGLSREEALPIIAGMADGLAYAHRRGIVHADFKPANVFLTRDGVPKILDFGIARAVQVVEGVRPESPDEDSVFSGFTITYAAPEVLEEKEPHTADDVFALGLVAYELLGGTHPFARRPANEARDARLRPRPLRDIRRREWKAIEKALAFDRAERWPDATAFAKSLQGATALQKALAGAVAILAVAAGGLWYQNYREAQPAIPFEQLPEQQRADVLRWLAQGRESLRMAAENKIIEASADAAYEFAEAYRIHPRNPDAVKGLDEAADYFIEWWDSQPDQKAALSELKTFQAKSDYYLKYRPLVSAIEDLEAGS
jgi:serine/threonine protein kinase